MAKEERLDLYLMQIQTSVSFTSFMTAVVIFFTGLLLTQFESFGISIKVPISFLIISTFGFLYSSLIFANASEEITQGKVSKFRKYMSLGDTLSEYLGVYLLVVSIPLVINALTPDIFLRVITVIASLGGLAIYQYSNFSIAERHFGKLSHILSAVVMLFGLGLFVAQIQDFYFAHIAVAFSIFMLATTFWATKKGP